ncbi:MAG TPA: M48 family metallopeptidase [Acetivibrio sp.]|uniref:M48 metallopeptidase family protein n=1 Tax=Acetivibrio sp. TaxID=1872092 RepID=UPI002B6D9696|nr:M48 family metallopeptidase [Acetivibrio sp.]HOM03373.1 M48 family metallopeptidase [Acetivibrio sp.]
MMTSETFKEEVLMLASKVGVKPKQIYIQPMKRKWGSCSSRGRLTFDKKLLDEPKEVRFRVILHELLHLKYPNHGKMFRSLLSAYLQKSLDSGESN